VPATCTVCNKSMNIHVKHTSTLTFGFCLTSILSQSYSRLGWAGCQTTEPLQQVFSHAGCPSCHPTVSKHSQELKALTPTTEIWSNHPVYLIFSLTFLIYQLTPQGRMPTRLKHG